jgi:hypothetical protein
VPLCVKHHAELHRAGVERDWWRDRHVDPIANALQLWRSEDARHQKSGNGAS